MKNYVAGFAVDRDQGLVALIRKSHPEWQAGMLNGVGGHVDAGEHVKDAMRREFLEEAGVHVDEWRLVLELSGRDWRVYFFIADVSSEVLDQLTGQPDEPIEIHPLDALADLPVIPNLRWIIPLCLDEDEIEARAAERAGREPGWREAQ